MSVDLDPLFLRGLRLLHSRARDSADQLRQLLDEVLAQKHGGPPPIAPLALVLSRQDKNVAAIKQESDVKHSLSRKVSPKHVSCDLPSSKSSHEEPKRKEAEKRQFERLKQELSDLQALEHSKVEHGAQHPKRPRLDSPHSSSSLSSSPSPQPLVVAGSVKTTEGYSEPSAASGSTYQEMPDSGTSDDTTDAEGFALQMGLTCVICKLLDASSRNQLIECQECHNLYHQECHRPPVTEQENNDPRHVWYCAKCTKTMKKVTTKVVPKPSKGLLLASVQQQQQQPLPSSRDAFTSAKVMKAEVPAPPSLLPFKRTEVKTLLVQSGSVSMSCQANKPTGLASLAANLGARPSVPPSLTPATGSHAACIKSGFGPSKIASSTSMLASKPALPFSALSALSSKPPGGSLPPSLASPKSGLASLANAAAVVSKSSSSSSSKHATLLPSVSASRSAPALVASASGNNGGGNGGGGPGSSVGSKTAVSSSLMSADKRLQIMKKKAAAKMQEKRRLSTK